MHPNIFIRVHGMPGPVYSAWSPLPPTINQLEDPHSSNPHYLMTPDRLKTLKTFLLKKPLSPVTRIIEYGETVSEEELERTRFNQSRARVSKGLRTLWKRKDQQTKVGSSRTDRNTVTATVTDSVTKMLEAQEKLKMLSSEAGENSAIHSTNTALHQLSPLAGVTIGMTTSTKLDYILNEV